MGGHSEPTGGRQEDYKIIVLEKEKSLGLHNRDIKRRHLGH